MTPRELEAYSRVHYSQVVMRWAIDRADFFNAHFRGKDTAAWLAEDFLGEGNREKRTREQQREALMVQRANATLAMKIKKGAPPTEDIPAWAIGEMKRAN